MHVNIVLNVLEMLNASVLDAYLLDRNAKMLHERNGIVVCAVGCSEAWHCDSHDSLTRILELVECLDANEQGKR